MSYHGHNAASFAWHVANRWEYDEHGNATLSIAPWGGPCTLIYNFHHFPQKVGEIAPDVIALERIDNAKRRDVSRIFAHERDIAKANPDAPVYRVDIALSPTQQWLLSNSVLLEATFALIGINMLLNQNKRKLPRYSALGTYLAGKTLTATPYFFSRSNPEIRAVLAPFTQTMDDFPTLPALLITVLRDTIAAEKETYLATLRSEEMGRPAHLAAVWGAGHAGHQSQIMRSSKERLETLQRWKPIIEDWLSDPDKREVLWTCKRIRAHYPVGGVPIWEDTGEVVEVPSLKAFFEKTSKEP